MNDNIIRSKLHICYKADMNNKLLRVSVRNDRVLFVQWDDQVSNDLLEADNQRIFGLLAGLFGFASACSQHTHVLCEDNYGVLKKAPLFEVELISTDHIPYEVVELINHFNAISTVGKIIPRFINTSRTASLPRTDKGVSLISGGKDSAWNLNNCNNKGIKHTSLFVEGTTINAEFINELPGVDSLTNHFGVGLRHFKVWHADTSWKSLIMQHRTIWRDLVLIVLARMVGQDIYTGINYDNVFDSLDKKIQQGTATDLDRFQLGFHFHNSPKALQIIAKALEAKIHKIPSEFEVYKDLKIKHPKLLDKSYSCQDPIQLCDARNGNNWDISCSKCKTLAVYDYEIEGKEMPEKQKTFAESLDFGGDMEFQADIIERSPNHETVDNTTQDTIFDVAISYASEDAVIAHEINSFLSQLGQKVYMYQERLHEELGRNLYELTTEIYKSCKYIIALSSASWSNDMREFIKLERDILISRLKESIESITVIHIDESPVHQELLELKYIEYNSISKDTLLENLCKRLKISASEYLINKLSTEMPVYGSPVDNIHKDNKKRFLNTHHRNHYLWLLLYSGENSDLYDESVEKYANPLMYKHFINERSKINNHDQTFLKRIDHAIKEVLRRTYSEYVENLIEIPGGEVNIGYPEQWYKENESGIPADLIPAFANNHIRKIHIPTFWIDKYPVTRRWASLLGTKLPNDFAILNHMNGKVEEDAPITLVNYHEANDLAEILGRRIPSQIEWEKAARGGVYLDHSQEEKNPFPERLYPWNPADGNIEHRTLELGLLNDNEHDQITFKLQDIKLSTGESPYGVKDMCGNAWEWVNNSDDEKVVHIKGGSFNNTVFEILNTKVGMVCGNPTDVPKETAFDNLGFRSVCDKKPTLNEFEKILIKMINKTSSEDLQSTVDEAIS